MHSLDTVKTRQQGDPHWPPKYRSLGDAYLKIFRQEGVRRGLYGGFSAAMLGSFPGTVVFFGAYETCKRSMLDYGLNPSFSYLTSGMCCDSRSFSDACANHSRLSCRLCSFDYLRSVRSPQDPSSAAGPLQQPVLLLGLQLQVDVECGKDDITSRRTSSALLWLQGYDSSRSALFCHSICAL